MHPFMKLSVCVLASTLSVGVLHAQNLPRQELPGVVTAAPLAWGSTISPSDAAAPEFRAGGPLDAGPMNSTPFSASGSLSLTSTFAGRALNASRNGSGFMPSIGSTD